MAGSEQGAPSPIFIGGAGRSGTTLVRVILDSHSRIACGPELKVLGDVADLWLKWQTALFPTLQEYLWNHEALDAMFQEMVLWLLTPYWNRTGKARIAEKSPNNVFIFRHLHQIFPDSPLIHVIRDGRDVVASLLASNWQDLSTGQPVEYTRDVQKAAEYWVAAVQSGRQMTRHPTGKARYFEIRYESIVTAAEETLKELFAHVGERWEAGVMDFHIRPHDLAQESSAHQVVKPLYSTAIGRWKRDLTASQAEIVQEIAGPLLEELGYM